MTIRYGNTGGLLLLATILAMSGCNRDREVPVYGRVAPGYEAVRDAFIRNFNRHGELGAACAVVVNNELVVDLWGGYRTLDESQEWDENTMVRVYSATKGMGAIVMALLHSRGLWDLDDPVIRHWPEFGKNGKSGITMGELLQHRSGLVTLERPLNVSELEDFDSLSPILENAVPLWESGSRQGYSAATLGLYEQQLARRLDPADRSIGEIFRDDVASPLGAEFHIGLPPDFDPDRLAELQMISANPLKGLFNLQKPPKGMPGQIINPKSLFNQAFFVIRDDTGDPLAELGYEEPSGGGVGTARGLAVVYGEAAAGGSRIELTPETARLLGRAAPPPGDGWKDAVMGFESVKSEFGFLKPDDVFDFGGPEAYGFSGSGGSFAFADPKHRLGYAYVMNRMDYYGVNDPRDIALREAVYQCLEEEAK